MSLDLTQLLTPLCTGAATFALMWGKSVQARAKAREDACDARVNRLEDALSALQANYMQDLVSMVSKVTAALGEATRAQEMGNKAQSESTHETARMVNRIDTLVTILDPAARLHRLQSNDKTPTATDVIKEPQ